MKKAQLLERQAKGLRAKEGKNSKPADGKIYGNNSSNNKRIYDKKKLVVNVTDAYLN